MQLREDMGDMTFARPSQPAWVMTGVTNPDGTVTLFASKSLKDARFNATAPPGSHEPWPSMRVINPRAVRVDLHVVMDGDVVSVTGRNFREAFELLFRAWSADDGMLEIEG